MAGKWLFLSVCAFFLNSNGFCKPESAEEFFASAPKQETCIYCNAHPMRILHETEHFRVLVDTYPIIPGHIMLSGKEHLAAVGALDAGGIQELAEIKEKIALVFRELFGNVLFYEHGRVCCCENIEDHKCDHFHMHCLPSAVGIHHAIAEVMPKFYPIGSLADVANLYETMGEYLYFENASGQICLYPVEKKIPSHFIRTLLCNALSVPERASWNRRKDLSEYLESYDLCNDRIKKALQ